MPKINLNLDLMAATREMVYYIFDFYQANHYITSNDNNNNSKARMHFTGRS